jgi:ABC-type transporter Mla maintaining outer membrane lipid asymmetry ATPase subunit MlaF
MSWCSCTRGRVIAQGRTEELDRSDIPLVRQFMPSEVSG